MTAVLALLTEHNLWNRATCILLIDKSNEWQSRQWYHMQSRHVYINLLLSVRVENRLMQMIEISKTKKWLQVPSQAIKKNKNKTISMDVVAAYIFFYISFCASIFIC